MNVNYYDTFIAVADDSAATEGSAPPARENASAANIQHQMLVDHPYKYTQEDILFASSTEAREATNDEARADARAVFFDKSRACLRASALGKRYGWGIHFDHHGRAAAFGVDSSEYQKLIHDPKLTQTKAMRSARK